MDLVSKRTDSEELHFLFLKYDRVDAGLLGGVKCLIEIHFAN